MNWSAAALKMTLGVGCLAQTAILADAFEPATGLWGFIALVMVLVVMIRLGDDLPARIVKSAHAVAALWYVSLSLAAFFQMVTRGFEKSDILMGVMIAAGLIPCVVIARAIRAGDYGAGIS